MLVPETDEISDKISSICRGNPQAIEFLTSFFQWVHWLDDVADGEADITAKGIVEINLTFLLTVTQNPFWLEHSAKLLPLIVQGSIAWIDSEEWAKREGADRTASDVLKGYYHEVFFHTAFILGGWEHALDTTRQHRAYDYE